VSTKLSGERSELVLLDLSRQNQVAVFAGKPESLVVAFEEAAATPPAPATDGGPRGRKPL
jgi:hypothetical protein